MFQSFLIGALFLVSLGFLIAMVVKNFKTREGCASGCGKCATTRLPSTPKL
ncbi:MAG: FeoB-associated Cys-rich membrane protein [Cyclobacteriaceae bacterium]|nr:FeoB-associated Cys-rich membrane protein [Cyclobacteriaceae bacterium]